MSVSGILSSGLFNYDTQNTQITTKSNLQQFLQEFKQLGQDMQSGNLSAAQTDFTTLQQLVPQNNSGSTPTSATTGTFAKDFQQLAQDLQSGNLSAAQQDYTKVQQDVKIHVSELRHHHRLSGGDGGSSPAQQLFQQLGQDLQSGNLSAAQQVYASLQQDFQSMTQNSGNSISTQSQSSSPLSVSA
jgi:soluble cytochrome b562